CRQRQLRGFKQCPAGERGLVPTRPALVVGAALATEARARPAVAAWAAEALRPARLVQRPVALGFSAVARKELSHRQALLELHPVHRHDRPPRRNTVTILPVARLISCDSWLRFGANQELLISEDI